MDDRKALSAAVGSVVRNASNHPNPMAVLGRDISLLREKIVDEILASAWLAAHDREVEAKALEAAAAGLGKLDEAWAVKLYFAFSAWLRARAATIRPTPATDLEPTETNGEQR